MPHDLSHSHSQLLASQINPLSHIPLSTNSLHSNLHLSSFHRYLLLQTLALNINMHLQVSCHLICLVSLIIFIKLNTLTSMFFIVSGTHNLAYGSLILLQFPLHLFTLTLKDRTQVQYC